jgi:N-acetylmuramoyl-L-alanine amidase
LPIRSSVEQYVCHQNKVAVTQLICLAVAALSLISAPSAQSRSSKKAAPAPVSHHSTAAASHHSAAAASHHSVAGASRHGSSRQAVEVSSRHSHGSIAAVSSGHGASSRTTHALAHTIKGKHGRTYTVVTFEGSKKKLVVAHRGRYQRGVIITHEVVHVVKAAPHTRYAYPLSFFLLHPPEFERSALPSDVSNKISRSFHQGYADSYTARSLVRAGIVSYHPLRGGIFWRREPVKYIIMHSTETGIPLSAERVIESWSSSGLRHAGAQYVVERDGTIFQAVDPDLGTVHINIFKTLPGINNDNSIGIEMCHTGRQDYPAPQRESVVKLVSYLQERYKVADENVITHRYAQQGDHTDPVNFDWDGFIANKNSFRNRAIAYKVHKIKDDVKDWNTTAASNLDTSNPVTPTVPTVREYDYSSAPAPEATTILQPHRVITEPALPVYKTTTTTTTVTSTPSVVPTQETKMILIPPKPDVAEPAAAVPMVLPKNMPSLRGPIEMPPQSAPGLNNTPGDAVK